MSKKEEQALEVKAANALVLADITADAGDSGFEGTDGSCFAIPYLTILQSGSPQCKKSEGAYLKGTEEGFLFNNVTEAFWDGELQGCDVVCVAFKRCFNEWISKDAGGGFQGEHDVVTGERLLATCTKNDKGHDILPNGHQLSDTRKHFVMYRQAATADAPAGPWKPALISMSSTQTKKSKKWMYLASEIVIPGTTTQAPLYTQIYHLSTVPESNDKGSWYGWKISHVEQIADAELYKKVKEFREMVRTGAAVETPPPSDNTSDEVPY